MALLTSWRNATTDVPEPINYGKSPASWPLQHLYRSIDGRNLYCVSPPVWNGLKLACKQCALFTLPRFQQLLITHSTLCLSLPDYRRTSRYCPT